MEKLARWRWILFAGCAVMAACAQQNQESSEVGTTRVELRSPLDIPGSPVSPSPGTGNQPRDKTGLPPDAIQPTRRIFLPGDFRPDPSYASIQRYERTPASGPAGTKSSEGKEQSQIAQAAWNPGDKPEVGAGQGFGVGADTWIPVGSVHLNDAHYYSPSLALHPYSGPGKLSEPVSEAVWKKKPRVLHDQATGWVFPAKDEALPDEGLPEERADPLRPIPETRVYFSAEPETRVTLTPAPGPVDILNGNRNLNRHRYQNLP